MIVAITGSTGFIGGFLVDRLIKQGYEVVCLVRKDSNIKSLKKKNVEIREIDYMNPNSLSDALKDIEIIFHLAALINSYNWNLYYNANFVYTKALVDTFNNIDNKDKKFIFISSIAASGPSVGFNSKRENDPDNPVSLYGKSKLLAENYIKNNAKFDFIILRPANVYGPYQKEFTILLNLLNLRILPLLGKRSSLSSFIYIEDFIDAIMLSMSYDKAIGQTYFVCDKKSYSWRMAIKEISRELNRYPYVIPIPNFIVISIVAFLHLIAKLFKKESLVNLTDILNIRKYNWIYDSMKIEKDLNFKTKTDLLKGLKKTIAWFKKRN